MWEPNPRIIFESASMARSAIGSSSTSDAVRSHEVASVTYGEHQTRCARGARTMRILGLLLGLFQLT